MPFNNSRKAKQTNSKYRLHRTRVSKKGRDSIVVIFKWKYNQFEKINDQRSCFASNALQNLIRSTFYHGIVFVYLIIKNCFEKWDARNATKLLDIFISVIKVRIGPYAPNVNNIYFKSHVSKPISECLCWSLMHL